MALFYLSFLTLLSTLFSSVVAQDGFTWWTYPNSTGDISFQEGQVVTLQWVTDYPTYSILLYQYIGEGEGEGGDGFTSQYIVGKRFH